MITLSVLTIDHIIPQSFFNFENKTEIEYCWNVKNLRYITQSENSSKNNGFDLDQIPNLNSDLLQIFMQASLKTNYLDSDKINELLPKNPFFNAVKDSVGLVEPLAHDL